MTNQVNDVQDDRPQCGSIVASLENRIRASLIDGSEPWPLPVSETHAIDRLFVQLGLYEKTPDGHRKTDLGEAMDLDLLMVFLSMWDEGEVPEQLLNYGLISENECNRLWQGLDDGSSYADLKPVVSNAYAAALDRGLIRLRLN